MKALAAFGLGALIASGVVLYIVKRDRQAPAATSATQATTAATPSLPQPPAAEPAPAPAPAQTATRPAKKKDSPREVAANTKKPAETPATPAPVATRTPDPPPAAPAPAPAATAEPPRATPAPPPPRQPTTVTLAAGTLLSVRLGETLSSDRNEPGDTFLATLDQPLIVDGFVIAERGARLEGRVAEIDKAGRVRGLSKLSVELVKLPTADGQRIAIQTDPFVREGEASKGGDAAKVGAAAGIGAAIGAIAGGGKGAAIGAAAGGAAGTGTVLATRGKPAELRVETRISFRLREPVSITERVR